MDLPQAVKSDSPYVPKVWDLRRTFAPSVLVLAAITLAFFLAFVEYHVPLDNAYAEHVTQYYTWLIDVEMMIFFGFGFLMTFLRRYSYSAVGLNFFTSALVMIEGILIIGAVQQIMGERHHTISLDIPLIIDATFCAGSAMIAFGAVLGKTSPTQLTWLLAVMVRAMLQFSHAGDCWIIVHVAVVVVLVLVSCQN
jgi:ammonium transporter Rh